ncbi:hypothetical protein PSTT_09661 [Puccinia striiformis]|uniref:Integrase catalytic domain-containing protein n=1 Tax=Puccinia striiformis TaxID=27350 RepID=A0A2S4V7C7_9BASI|nr:hypothetical protein PSTT_09661 [Puccinia striiformis]
MDQTNSQRFRSLYNDEVNHDECKPDQLWILIKDHHQCENEAAIYLYQTKLDQLEQDQSTSVTEHIDSFIKIKTEILNRGGYLEDITIARKLLSSMHSTHRDEVRHIIRVYVPLTFRAVTLALKQYELENLQLKNKSVNKMSEKMTGLNVAGNTNVKKKCTPTHCLGPHNAAKCFQKPENAAAKKAWFDRMRNKTLANHVDSNPKEEESIKPESPPADVKPSASNTEGKKKKDWAFPTFCVEANSVDSIREAIWDSGASQHMFRSSYFFDQETMKKPNPSESQVGTAGSEEIPIEGTGTVWVKGQTLSKFRLLNALYVPGLRHNLIAAGALHKQGAVNQIDPNNEKRFEVVIGDEIFLRGRFENFLMIVRIEPVSDISQANKIEKEANISESQLLHNRLGHLNDLYLSKTTGNPQEKIDDCDTCKLSKATRLPFSGTRPKSCKPLDNLHIDLSGIIRIPCIYNYSYFLLIIDEFTRMTFIYFLKSKTKEEIFESINSFIIKAERHWDRKVKMITTDGGGEFINSLLMPYCHELGIMKNTTAPYTPQQNSIVERSMRTIVTKARSMMIHSGVPPRFWSLACQSAVFIQNQIYTKARKEDDEIPYKLWYGHDPNRDYIRTFGCLAYIHNRKEIRDNKISPTSRKGFLVGFDEFNKNY